MLRTYRNLALSLLAVAASGSTLLAQGGAPAPKLAYVNSQTILSRAPGSAEVQQAIAKEREGLMAQAQKLQDSLKTMFDDLNKVSATLTATQREQREKAFRDKQAEFDQRVGQMDQQMQARQFELVQPLMNQIREVLETIRNEEGYLFVFDVGAEANNIVAADKNLDITDRVIARLKPISVNLTRSDSTKAPAAAKPAPAGITKPPVKPPTR